MVESMYLGIPFGGVQCLLPYDAFNSKYSICEFNRRNIKNPAARLAIVPMFKRNMMTDSKITSTNAGGDSFAL